MSNELAIYFCMLVGIQILPVAWTGEIHFITFSDSRNTHRTLTLCNLSSIGASLAANLTALCDCLDCAGKCSLPSSRTTELPETVPIGECASSTVKSLFLA